MKQDLRPSLSFLVLLLATLGLTQSAAPLSTAAAAKMPTTFATGAMFCGSGVKTLVSGARALTHAVKPPTDELQEVLAQMNVAAGNFNSAQGDFEYKIYQKVVDDMFVQKGSIYFRRTKSGTKIGVDAALRFTSPDDKQVVFKDGKLKMYEPKINQITEPDVSKSKASVESFLSLGFGARGDDLPKDYDVNMEGWENIDGVKTAKLALVPKNEKLRNTYNKIILWIDPVKDVSLQQQFFESAGNYRLTHYTNLKINGRLPSDAFNINTSTHPKTVRPQ
jgi:outer membrane lipoprotein-sorting protein